MMNTSSSPSPIPHVRTEDRSAVDYESADEIDDSKYQVLWANVMEKGRYVNPLVYQKAEVLILCWEQSSSDMDTMSEITRLRSVFEKSFGYHVNIEYLNANLQKKLQVQVNHRVAGFVGDHDGLNTLLIVYYAGHGKPGENFGSLELMGKTSPNSHRDKNKRTRNSIVWNKTEELLRPAEADVLEIFDWTQLTGYRLFEYLAATRPQDTTELPGDKSFTSALIWALERMVEEKPQGRFTTKELLDKIKTDAPNFPKDQTPVLSDRDDTKHPAGRIMLHPLQADRTMNERSGPVPAMEPAEGHRVTLHFEFGKKPSDERLWSLGERVNEVFERHTFQVHRVRWGGMNRTTFGLAARRFQAPLRKRRASDKGRPIAQVRHVTPRSSTTMAKLDTNLLSPQRAEFGSQDSTGNESAGSPQLSSAPTSDLEGDSDICTKTVISIQHPHEKIEIKREDNTPIQP
ncbi:MAG: hypothetical protein Q9225_005106 [Loekoesia sp. 1 TL-2023]